MDLPEALAFLRKNHRAVLATSRRDGRPQLSPVLVAVDDEDRIVISTRAAAMKTKNVERDDKVTICAFRDEFFGAWVSLDGRADIVRLPEAMDGLVDYYRRISGEHPDWADYRAAMARDRRVLLRVAVERVGPNRAG